MKLSNMEKRKFLQDFIESYKNQAEKEVLTAIKASVKVGSAVEKVMSDLLTNHFDVESSGYFFENLQSHYMVYTGAQINALYNAVVNYIENKKIDELRKESAPAESQLRAVLSRGSDRVVGVSWDRVNKRLKSDIIESGSDCGRYIIVNFNGFLFRINDGAHNIYSIEVIAKVEHLNTLREYANSLIDNGQPNKDINFNLESIQRDLNEMNSGVSRDHINYLSKQIDTKKAKIQLIKSEV